jgi:hypothetical protein
MDRGGSPAPRLSALRRWAFFMRHLTLAKLPPFCTFPPIASQSTARLAITPMLVQRGFFLR